MKHGDERIKIWFAIFPVTIRNGDNIQTRWFEFVTVRQTVGMSTWYNLMWFNREFID